MIVGPSPYDGVELNDQMFLRRRLIFLDNPSDLCQSRLNVLLGRRDQQFPSILAYVLAEKIKTLSGCESREFFPLRVPDPARAGTFPRVVELR
jgi:hypothetical protein